VIAAGFATALASLGLGRYDGEGPADAVPIHLEGTPPTGDYLAVYVEPLLADDGSFDEWRMVLVRVVARVESDGGRNRAPQDLAMAVLDAFDGLESVEFAAGTPDELTVNHCWARDTTPVPLGPDDRGVPKWSAVLMATVRHQTAHRERQPA